MLFSHDFAMIRCLIGEASIKADMTVDFIAERLGLPGISFPVLSNLRLRDGGDPAKEEDWIQDVTDMAQIPLVLTNLKGEKREVALLVTLDDTVETVQKKIAELFSNL